MRVYLDHNATAPILPEVACAMTECLQHEVGNPSSLHREGRRARELVEAARAQVAALLAAEPSEVVFTSGGTEACALALGGVPGPAITTGVEHPAVAGVLAGRDLRVLPVGGDGLADPDDLDRLLRERPAALVSVQAANHETGVVQDVSALARVAHAHGALLHCDAVQAAGRRRIDAHAEGLDLVSLSAHKLHGPQGAGAAIVRRGLDLGPLWRGGHQERERRPGTENVAGIVGFGVACEAATRDPDLRACCVARLRRRLEEAILAIDGARLHGHPERRGPNTVNAGFPGAPGDAVAQALDLAGVAVSTGAACTSGSLEPSPVLLAMGLSRAQARSAVRFSLGRDTTEREIEYVASLLPSIVERVRRHERLATA